METSGFWEGRKGKSHLEEKYSQATPRNCFPLGSSFTYCSAQDKGGSSKWNSFEFLWNCVWAIISGCDCGGRCIKTYAQCLSQNLAVINDLVCIRHLCPQVCYIPFSLEIRFYLTLGRQNPRELPRRKVNWTLRHTPHQPNLSEVRMNKTLIHHARLR